MALPSDGMIFTVLYPDQVEHGLKPEPSLHPSRKTIAAAGAVPATALAPWRVSFIVEALNAARVVPQAPRLAA